MNPEQVHNLIAEQSVVQRSIAKRSEEFVSTGSLGLDLALGTGGWPLRKISVIYGETFSGKSTLALSTLREMQRLGIRSPKYSPTVAYINYDRDFNPDYARAIGVDVGRLVVLAEMPAIEAICPIDFMVVNSVWGRYHAQAVRGFAAYQGIITILAVCPDNPMADPDLLSDATVRVKLNRLPDSFEALTTKNPYAPTAKTSFFRLGHGGIDRLDEVFQVGVQKGLIRKQGSWYYVGDKLLGQGECVSQRALQSDRDLYRWVTEQILYTPALINLY